MFPNESFLEPDPRALKPFTLPPDLDMGTLKAEDLHFDVVREAARLRAAAPRRP